MLIHNVDPKWRSSSLVQVQILVLGAACLVGGWNWCESSSAQVPSQYLQSFAISTDLQILIENTTVRVYAGSTAGSGVIVNSGNNRYQVLTNRHVVEWGSPVRILTADRQFHTSNSVQIVSGLDLAILTFQSDRRYPVAPLSPTLPLVGTPVYAAGFPLYQAGQAQDTTALGRQAFNTTSGQIVWILSHSAPDGYSLGYSNAVAIGMSGGPLFNPQGQVVGINGRSSGRDAGFGLDTLGNGQLWDPAFAAQMAELSWGIPVAEGIPGLAISPQIPKIFEPTVNFESPRLEPTIPTPGTIPTPANSTIVSPVNSGFNPFGLNHPGSPLITPTPLESETVPDSIQPSETLTE